MSNTRNTIAAVVVLATALLLTARAQAGTVHRHALLIGISDYSASRLPTIGLPAPGRSWSNLDGAATDVAVMRELLLKKKGFAAADVAMLTDQEATRAAILDAIDKRLVCAAGKGDIVLFYYSGHGSQVRNTRSDEDDFYDESLVPADSRRGALDVRDKELRTRFNAILDQGAQLTVVLDSCHSASAARGFDAGAHVRALGADERDVADPPQGPRPEDHGALVFAAAQDFDSAYETIDHGEIHGAFSWALARAVRDGPSDEPAEDTFARVEARLRVEMPLQEPVIAGTDAVRKRPFLVSKAAPRVPLPVIAVEGRLPSGEYVLTGGWINGVTVGTRLRLPGHDGVRYEVTSVNGISQATARVVGETNKRELPLSRGTLLEIATWAAPPARPLRVCIPRGLGDVVSLRDLDGVEVVASPEFADYVLVRRPAGGGVEYAWIRPGPTVSDSDRTPLPVRTAWVTASDSTAASALRELLTRLARVHGWLELESPHGPTLPYQLAVRRDRDGSLIGDGGTLIGEQSYHLVLCTRGGAPVPMRYVYVFVVDSSGSGVLLFPSPNSGFVENRVPVAALKANDPHREIPLGREAVMVDSPYGKDTYFLLTTGEPLPSLASLHWNGVRGPQIVPHSELERLLLATASGTRGDAGTIRTPASWSIDKVIFKSVPPRRNAR
ncbi:MAG TPA: caspase family protein [Thermoanaerobaculia bacterium]|nr:caspase family protein [Thermoanaerobaculia bacterium]